MCTWICLLKGQGSNLIGSEHPGFFHAKARRSTCGGPALTARSPCASCRPGTWAAPRGPAPQHLLCVRPERGQTGQVSGGSCVSHLRSAVKAAGGGGLPWKPVGSALRYTAWRHGGRGHVLPRVLCTHAGRARARVAGLAELGPRRAAEDGDRDSSLSRSADTLRLPRRSRPAPGRFPPSSKRAAEKLARRSWFPAEGTPGHAGPPGEAAGRTEGTRVGDTG